MTKAYQSALTAHDAAYRVYSVSRDAYRARTVGDIEFIAAKDAWNAATAIFDKAFAKEANRSAKSSNAALNDFNYVGSRHHY